MQRIPSPAKLRARARLHVRLALVCTVAGIVTLLGVVAVPGVEVWRGTAVDYGSVFILGMTGLLLLSCAAILRGTITYLYQSAAMQEDLQRWNKPPADSSDHE